MDEFVSLHEYLPALAEKETTVIYIKGTESSSLSAGEYLLLESYCDGKDCDCRKVMLNVVSKNFSRTILATIGYGWETTEFYMSWAFGDKELVKQIQGVYLEPMCTQSIHSEIFLQLIKKAVKEESFKLIMIRHYQLFKNILAKK